MDTARPAPRTFVARQEDRDLTRDEGAIAETWLPDMTKSAYDLPLDDVMVAHPALFVTGQHYEYFKRLREERPIAFHEDSLVGPFWSITKFRDIMEIEKNHDVFSSDGQIAGGTTLGVATYEQIHPKYTLPMFIMSDPPKHTSQRRVVQPKFMPSGIRNYEGLIRERICDVLDNLPVNEEFDWVKRVSVELTARMLATLFDVPQEDRYKLIGWSDVVGGVADSEMFENFDQMYDKIWECYDYFKPVWDQRLADGKPGDDLISMLAYADATKDMPPNEILGNLLTLIVGGNDTTRNTISGGLLALNRNPGEYQKLRDDPSLIPSMASEMIRYQSPVAHMVRVAKEDVDFHGHKILKGDRVALWYMSGNRDADEIDSPDSFIIDRKTARHHISFGFGIHRCVGYRLAELQLKLLWEELVRRFDNIEVVGEPKILPSIFLNGIRELPVRITK